MKLIRFLERIDRYANKFTIIAVAVALITIVGLVVWGCWRVKDDHISLLSSGRIDPSPTLIEQMREIGQWEFLTISDEEIVDTLRRGFFSNDELVRIYYGTLRLGIDFSKCEADWIEEKDDTIFVTIPDIQLLDSTFIDEASTKSFFESGKWSNVDRQMMYNRARSKMLKRCMTKENIRTATENAHEQILNTLQPMTDKSLVIKNKLSSNKN